MVMQIKIADCFANKLFEAINITIALGAQSLVLVFIKV